MLAPPLQVSLADWAEKYFVLAEGGSPRPGRFRCWPYQRGILDAIGDPEIERVSVIKPTRIGYTKSLIAGICARVDMDPCSMILLVPTDEDARGYAVDEVEPAFEECPKLAGLMVSPRDAESRSTLTTKYFLGGGSLKILSARAPRNLRRHDAKILFVDEEDAMEITREGNPVALGERRTMAHPDRKIVRGSSPTDDVNSSIVKAYDASDQRIYQVPCPHCGTFFEILLQHIVWPKGRPEDAVCACPHCYAVANAARAFKLKDMFTECPQIIITERHKTAMVAAGTWLARAPHVKRHAGFRLNAFISLFHNARWGVLAGEFEAARRGGPSLMQPFVNTVEGRVWETSLKSVDEQGLAARVEDFGIIGAGRFPRGVLLLLAGVDTQDDRFEGVLWGFSETEAFLLEHHVIWGDPADSVTQGELDVWLKRTFPHPNGWRIGIEAAAIDSQGHKTQAVYDFCRPRLARRVYPIISRAGSRRIWEPSKAKQKDGGRLFIVGHDQAKAMFLDHLALPMVDEAGEPTPGRCRLSNDLPPETFDQLAGEKRYVRYVHNRTVTEFRPKKEGQPVEALDGSCYAWAVRRSMRVNFAERAARRGEQKPRVSLGELSGRLNG